MAITKISAAMADLDGAVTINNSGADADFRVESDGNSKALSILGDKYGLGVGRDPENAYNAYTSIELGQQGILIANDAGDDMNIMVNAYLDGSGNWKRKEAGNSLNISLDGDHFKLFDAESLGADTTITFVERLSSRYGDLTITDGNLVVASGHGINFAATGDGSGTDSSELLDDYEEGTWTPTIATGSITFSSARYTKVGRLIHISAQAQAPSDITTAAAVTIEGLPYPVHQSQAAGSVMGTYSDNTNATTVYVTDAEALYFYNLSNASWVTLRHDHFNSTSAYIYFQATYHTT